MILSFNFKVDKDKGIASVSNSMGNQIDNSLVIWSTNNKMSQVDVGTLPNEGSHRLFERGFRVIINDTELDLDLEDLGNYDVRAHLTVHTPEDYSVLWDSNDIDGDFITECSGAYRFLMSFLVSSSFPINGKSMMIYFSKVSGK